MRPPSLLLLSEFPRAGNGTRTRNHKLGRLVLYQLSYSRIHRTFYLRPRAFGEGRIRTSEGVASRFTVCPLWPLGNLSPKYLRPRSNGAGEGIRTPDLLITSQLLYRLSYASVKSLILRKNFNLSIYYEYSGTATQAYLFDPLLARETAIFSSISLHFAAGSSARRTSLPTTIKSAPALIASSGVLTLFWSS